VTVVTGVLVGVIQVRIVAVYTHLSFVGGEGFVFRRGLPVGVTASGRCSPAAVLAEVTIEADVSGWICGLRWIMAHTAGIVCRTVDQGVKIRVGLVQPSACVRYINEVVTVVTGVLVCVIQIRIVAVNAHLSFVSSEGFVFK